MKKLGIHSLANTLIPSLFPIQNHLRNYRILIWFFLRSNADFRIILEED